METVQLRLIRNLRLVIGMSRQNAMLSILFLVTNPAKNILSLNLKVCCISLMCYYGLSLLYSLHTVCVP